MPLTLDDIHAITRRVAAEQDPEPEIVTVASDLEQGRVELLVTIPGRDDAERLLLNLDRSEARAFEHELRAKLQSVPAARP